jgi:hypothetical protein
LDHAASLAAFVVMPKLRCSSFAAKAAAILSLLAGCAGGVDPGPASSGGSAGSGGLGSGGQNTAGVGGGSSGGAGSGGQSSGGFSGGGSSGGTGGESTGGVGGAGSSAGGSGGSNIPATFDTLKFVLQGTNPPCVASDCHGSGTHHPLTLAVNDQLYTTLTTHVSMRCGSIPLVTPGNPQQSALVAILKGPCGETPRMPNGCIEDEFGNTCVPDEYIAAIEQWVANGAPQ